MIRKLKVAALATTALVASTGFAEARCQWVAALSRPYFHAVFCSSPDDPDLARAIGIIAKRETLREIWHNGPVDLLERRPDGTLKKIEPYLIRLRTERREALG